MLPLALKPLLSSVWSGVWSFATSRIGQLVIVGGLAYVYGVHETNQSWQVANATEKAAIQAAHDKEIEREKTATAEIALAGTLRLQEGNAKAVSMQAQINALKAKEAANARRSQLVPSKAPASVSCVLDAERIERVRRLDAAGGRAP